MEALVFDKAINIFQRLGWNITKEEKIENSNKFADITLRYNDKIYGFVEIVDTKDLHTKTRKITWYLDEYLKEHKTPVFIITNGYKYDVYHYGEFYGSLTIPPSPKNVNTLFGGELNE